MQFYNYTVMHACVRVYKYALRLRVHHNKRKNKKKNETNNSVNDCAITILKCKCRICMISCNQNAVIRNVLFPEPQFGNIVYCCCHLHAQFQCIHSKMFNFFQRFISYFFCLIFLRGQKSKTPLNLIEMSSKNN